MLVAFLEELGIRGSRLSVNSIGCRRCRPAYLEVLREAIEKVSTHLCGDCQRRASTNPLRVLDCKVEADQAYIDRLPTSADSLCQECRDHFARVRELLDLQQVPYGVNPRLVRGLDYYERTTFEITSDALGAQNALGGGGRYDGLSESLGGPSLSGFGFALGEERFLLALPEQDWKQGRIDAYIAPLGAESFQRAVLLAAELRRLGLKVVLEFETRSLKSQMRQADRLRASCVLIFGSDEMARREIKVKDMETGEEKTVTLDATVIQRMMQSMREKDAGLQTKLAETK